MEPGSSHWCPVTGQGAMGTNRKFHLNIITYLFLTVQVFKHCNRLPRVFVDSRLLELFTDWLDTVLSNFLLKTNSLPISILLYFKLQAQVNIQGFCTPTCRGLHAGIFSDSAEDQRAKYLSCAISRIQNPQFYSKLHFIKHFLKYSERRKNIKLENIANPFSNKCHSTPHCRLHFLKIFDTS